MARNILNPENTEICMSNTKCDRFKDMKLLPGGKSVVTISNDSKICFWEVENLRTYGGDIATAKAKKTIKSKQRLLCLTVNDINEQEIKKTKAKKKDKNKKSKKISKDEKILLKRQKKA